ncbi:hypothetical protein HDZ31DRAFT_41155 [Schizophyllum fasciatum]
MATLSPRPSPSSSANTIPIPGKSILKRPPPPQQSLFSRITRFLPNQNNAAAAGDDGQPLKRAHFILPEIATVYPISSLNPPSTPTLKEEKRAIEDREAERRRRVLRGSSTGPNDEGWWSLDKVESFYRECCEGCDEKPDPAITNAFKHASPAHPRAVDFSGVQMTLTTASILSDVFTVEWGLRKLTFKECDLDEHTLKPILHALLIPNTLSYLSLESNKRLKTPAFRLVGVFLEKAQNMQFLDLSQNPLEKKAIEHIVAAIPTAPTPGLVSLRLDDCQLRHAALETLARSVRTSSLRNISLRYNRINQTGAVAIALMIRDYPDVVPSPASTPASSAPPSPVISGLPPLSPPTATLQVPAPPPPPRSGPVLPPPKHPAQAPPQTTYTPYIPRSRRGQAAAATTASVNPLSATGQHIPIITSSVQGGVTARHVPQQESGQSKHAAGPSAALLDKVRALDTLPRLGALRTLDLKGNDLRTGITYIAQVLKRNRTLKVLNLSENKLDVQCLISVAEALKYNSSLETLDLSKNPCCGPGLEGVQSLRTAFTLNTALKRLFLSSTQMTSAGAIALAEFLPESRALLHLDLTQNALELAGVMALSSGLKANHVMRCLDLNIPPGDEEFARMCREILSSCVRNTEEAEKNAHAASAENASAESGRGQAKGVWGMIEESELAKTIRLNEEKKIRTDVLIRGKAVVEELRALLDAPPPLQSQPLSLSLTLGTASILTSPSLLVSSGPAQPPTQLTLANSVARAQDLVGELAQVVTEEADAGRLEQLLQVNDALQALLTRVPGATGATTPTAAGSTSANGVGTPSERPTLNVDLPYSPRVMSPRASPRPSPLNGHALAGADEDPPTPRVDKGKGRAAPEPEPEEKVLSPTFMLARAAEERDGEGEGDGDGDGEGDGAYMGREGVASPTVRSRSWVEEEGEVFRKGTVLLGPEEMEGEYAGEELRRELLEAMVERPPPREVNEDGTRPLDDDDDPAELRRHPTDSLTRKTSKDSLTRKSSKDSLTARPYMPRRRSSSNSIMGVLQQAGPSSPVPGSPATGLGSPVPGSPVVTDTGAPALRRAGGSASTS